MEKHAKAVDAGQHLDKTAILTVSIGSINRNENNRMPVRAIEAAIERQFSPCGLRSISVNCRADREENCVKEALQKAAADGVRALIVQPLYLMHGYSYQKLSKQLDRYKEKFEQIVLGDPLLTSEEDFASVLQAMIQRTAGGADENTAICFVGHGGAAAAHSVYTKMQLLLSKAGYKNYYIGTIKAEPALEEVLQAMKMDNVYQRVILYPFMIGAGSHAKRDLAGDSSSSWKCALQDAGYEVTCILEGLGQIPAVQEIYVAHACAAVSRLK